MDGSYWQTSLNSRLSRRRALAATATAASGAALLAACGSDGNEKSDKSTLLTKPLETISQAKRGGVIKDRIHADVASLDVALGISALNASTSHTTSTLVMFKPGLLKPSPNELAPDMIESWEY